MSRAGVLAFAYSLDLITIISDFFACELLGDVIRALFTVRLVEVFVASMAELVSDDAQNVFTGKRQEPLVERNSYFSVFKTCAVTHTTGNLGFSIDDRNLDRRRSDEEFVLLLEEPLECRLGHGAHPFGPLHELMFSVFMDSSPAAPLSAA